MTPYDIDLDRNPANFQPLTPLSFLERSAAIFPDRPAIIHGGPQRSHAEFYARDPRLAGARAQPQPISPPAPAASRPRSPASASGAAPPSPLGLPIRPPCSNATTAC